jgi:hypothetical protein
VFLDAQSTQPTIKLVGSSRPDRKSSGGAGIHPRAGSAGSVECSLLTLRHHCAPPRVRLRTLMIIARFEACEP